ncbi:MAG TPA: carbohydrate ABC transporter permease [Nocardioidaceae bacterium]|nr:carbohydrate ABC transporter permease [Nocardioidaceae bacterium]
MATVSRKGWRRYVNGVNIGALAIAIAVAAPLYWMVVTSLKPPGDIATTPPQPLPTEVTGANYVEAFTQVGFSRYILNSVIVCTVATVLVLALSTFAGYALARMPMRGRGPLLIALLVISVYPTIAVLTPLYLMERQLGMLNTHAGLVVPYVAFNLPFAVWIMRNFMLGLPKDFEDAARVDGAGPTRTVLSVILPAVRPGLFTAGIFTFTATWTEFLMALTFMSEDSARTIPVGIALFGTQFQVPYGTIFAAAVAVTLPIAILVLIFRRSVVSGLTSGAVKG